MSDRCKKTFKIRISKDVLEYCASTSSSDHGDARRALDLLRTTGEICNGVKITIADIDSAQKLLQKDRAHEIVSSAPYHMRCIIGAIFYQSIIGGESWNATSAIYKKYTDLISAENKPLSYRRCSDLLIELDNSGLVVPRTYSKGRHGYGKEYKLMISPNLVGPVIGKDWFNGLIEQKVRTDEAQDLLKNLKKSRFGRRRSRFSGF